MGLFTGIARRGRACVACTGRGLEFAAAASDAKGGDQFLQGIGSASFAGNVFFSADGNKGFKMRSAFFAQKFVNWHVLLIITKLHDFL